MLVDLVSVRHSPCHRFLVGGIRNDYPHFAPQRASCPSLIIQPCGRKGPIPFACGNRLTRNCRFVMAVWGSLINSRPPQPSTLLFRYEAKAKFSLRSLLLSRLQAHCPYFATRLLLRFSWNPWAYFNEVPPHLDKYIVPQFVVFAKRFLKLFVPLVLL